MAEQERVQKLFEMKVSQLSELLEKEMDKSKLLESQLAENHKQIRMLSVGTSTLDHLLTIGQCPSTNRGLRFQGSTSKISDEKPIFVKEATKEIKLTRQEKGKSIIIDADVNQKLNKPRRRNGCHFCGRLGHHVRFCYFRQSLSTCLEDESVLCGAVYIWLSMDS